MNYHCVVAATVILSAGAALSAAQAPVCNVIPRPREIEFANGRYSPKGEPEIAYEKDASIPAEGYRLVVGKDGVKIASSDAAGRFYAGKTLAQLKEKNGWPCVKVNDWPEYGFRSVLVDDARVNYGKEGVKKIIDEMSEVKLNVFHWHFIEPGAWRMAMPNWPKLTEKIPREKRYERADIEEVVAYAAARHVRVMPEIEMPGHNDVDGHYPEFRHEGGRGGLCPTNPKAIEFYKQSLDWAAALFPEKIIHFGGDEVGYDSWKKCARCQAKMKELNFKTEDDLQAWFMNIMSDHLKAKGKVATGWTDILLNLTDNMHTNAAGWWTGYSIRKNLTKDIIINAWYGDWEYAGGSGAVAANMGYKVIQYPAQHCYFDYDQGLDDGYAYGMKHVHSFKMAYEWDPRSDVKPEFRKNILGVGCANWAEAGSDITALEWKLWPRGFATAEIGWFGGEKQDYADFKRRALKLGTVFRAKGIQCAIPAQE